MLALPTVARRPGGKGAKRIARAASGDIVLPRKETGEKLARGTGPETVPKTDKSPSGRERPVKPDAREAPQPIAAGTEIGGSMPAPKSGLAGDGKKRYFIAAIVAALAVAAAFAGRRTRPGQSEKGRRKEK